jgi:hypothetical protein
MRVTEMKDIETRDKSLTRVIMMFAQSRLMPAMLTFNVKSTSDLESWQNLSNICAQTQGLCLPVIDMALIPCNIMTYYLSLIYSHQCCIMRAY